MMARVMALPLLALGFGAPLVAQELAFSPVHTEACLQEAVGRGEVLACPGASARQCINENEGGFTTVGMGACLSYELDYWDARLNASYKLAMAEAKAIDAEMAALESAAPPIADALREMQRKWIPFRDAACDYERVQWGGGTGAGPATLTCLLEHTAQQTLVIEARFQ